jgi:hypothetical protein
LGTPANQEGPNCIGERAILFAYALTVVFDSLYGLVVRVPGYISRDPGFDSRLYQIILV